ncbi:MAG: hypothetical protein OXC82_05230 [Rhodobacteraceae bacterium]|nr:hypothetical protein [Paracoccaceae bacterium]MCY4249825.1 hypothetical protein [Paracoccaceae bacterium]
MTAPPSESLWFLQCLTGCRTGRLCGSAVACRVPCLRNAPIKDGSVLEEREGRGQPLRLQEPLSIGRAARLTANWDVKPVNMHDGRVSGELPPPSPSSDPQVLTDRAHRPGDAGRRSTLGGRGVFPEIPPEGPEPLPFQGTASCWTCLRSHRERHERTLHELHRHPGVKGMDWPCHTVLQHEGI